MFILKTLAIEGIFYDIINDFYIGVFEDGSRLVVSAESIPNDMSAYEFIRDIADNIDDEYEVKL